MPRLIPLLARLWQDLPAGCLHSSDGALLPKEKSRGEVNSPRLLNSRCALMADRMSALRNHAQGAREIGKY